MADLPPPTTPPRVPTPDVPPPPPGHWPLGDASRMPSPADRHRVGPAAVAGRGTGLGLPFAAIAVYLVGQLGLQLVAGIVLVATGVLDPALLDPEEGATALLAIVVASQTAGLLLVLLLLRRRAVPLGPLVGPLRPLGRHLGIGVGLGVATIVASLTVVSVLVGLSGNDAAPEQLLTGDIIESPLQVLLAVLIAVVLAPLAEELVFRGLLHRNLRRRMRIVPATLISSFLFAIVHVDVVLSQPIALVGLTLAGAVMAVAYERTGSLVVPVVIHAVYNATTLVALVVTSRLDPDLLVSTLTVLR